MHILVDIPPGGPANAIACAILKAQGDRLDRLGRIAEHELRRTNHARARLDHIIHVLIERLDMIDAATFDMEPWLAGSDPADEDREGEHGRDADTEAEASDDEPGLGWTIQRAGQGGGGFADGDGEQFLATTRTEDARGMARGDIWDDHESNLAAAWGEFQRGRYPIRQPVDESEPEDDKCVTDDPHDEREEGNAEESRS